MRTSRNTPTRTSDDWIRLSDSKKLLRVKAKEMENTKEL